MTAQVAPIPVPPHQRGEIGYHVHAERVASFQAHNPQKAPSPAPHAHDSHAPWQGPGIDIAMPLPPRPAPAYGYVPSPLYKDEEERPAKKVAFDPQVKKEESPKPAAPEAKAAEPQRGFVTVTTTTYPVFMQPAGQPVHIAPPQGAPVFMPVPPPVFIAQPAPAPKLEPVKAPVESPVAKQAPAVNPRPMFDRAYEYEREIYREKLRVHQAPAPVIMAPAPAAAPRPQVMVQAPVQRPQVLVNQEPVRVHQAPVIAAPAPVVVQRPQVVVQSAYTHTHHRYSVLHSWSPVVAFAITVIFTGFMVSLAAPIAAPILFPTAVMIAAGSLFLKAAMYRRC